MSLRRTGIALAAALLALTAPLGSATAAQPTDLALPPPTGSHPVGTDVLHVRDASRPDPWVPDQPRELMVTTWYPAAGPGTKPARYLSAEESRRFVQLQADYGGTPFEPADVLSTVGTHARDHAPALRTPNGHPLVVLSPGHSYPRALLTGMAEDLASRGYVVAAIGHNHESAGTEFPDGRVTPCVACHTDDMGAVARGRAVDARFVLDELTGHPRFSTLIDERRIAMVGHSIGGASAAEAMATDPRIDAGVNLDGTFPAPLPDEGLHRPFLMLGAEHHNPGSELESSWDETWQRLHGWKRWITMRGSGHGSATDVNMLANQNGIQYPGEPLPGARSAELANRYVAAFLDRHLRDRPQPILDGPNAADPEMLFWHR
ncbi:alpha/beta hydrolase [Saccharopolyspora sp. HNM0983]|uniref:Alpha/beta hydrolase n=1 Tax=Saccharopolyspora montiporae TaxID=2781240 RepID=A0A929B5X8_9PSEU|nr:alpha/beta hydrolase [Saccharopolyspora sp. HNM0983]MBE9373759.1 alpha/beta hydrolase [Saccharopolyspora sp. HNM0983]